MFDQLIPVVVFLVTAGVKEFFEKVLGQEMDSNISALIASVIGALAVFSNQIAANIPAQYVPVLSALVALVVTISSSFGIHATVKFFAGDK